MYAIFLNKDLMAVSIIRNSGCFTVNFIPYSAIEKVKDAMKTSCEFTEKATALGFEETECEKLVDCFKLKNALGWLECEVTNEQEFGDHIMFVGKVLFSHLDRIEKRPFHVDNDHFTTTFG